MQYGQPAGEPRREPTYGLRRQGDLRYQDQSLALLGQDLLEQRQVDLGLPAPGHTMEQKNLRFLAGKRDGDPFPGRLLPRLERDHRRVADLRGLPQDAALAAALHRSLDHGPNARRHDGPDHLVERHLVVRGDETGQLDEHGGEHRLGVEQRLDRFELQDRRPLVQCVHETGHRPLAEGHPDPVSDLDHAGQRLGYGVIEQPGLASHPGLHGDLRDRLQSRVRRRGCDSRQWHPRSARRPPTWAAAAPRRPRRTG